MEGLSRESIFHESKTRVHLRPQNAFFVFSNMHRQQLRERMPHLSNTEVSKHLEELWSKMTADHQALYYEEAQRRKFGIRDHLHEHCSHSSSKVSVRSVPKEELEQEIKFGGYVPPFHIFSAKMKRLEKMKKKNEQRKHITSLPEFTTYAAGGSQIPEVPVISKQSVSVEHGNGDSRCTPPLAKRRHMNENEQAVAHITYAGDNHGPYMSRTDHSQQHYRGPVQDNCPSYCSHYPNTKCSLSGASHRPDMQHYSHITHESAANCCHPNVCQYSDNLKFYSPPHEKHQRLDATMLNPGRGQDSARYDSCGVAMSNQTVEGEEETNYVLVPCDINVAKMLGWPIHMLQRVSRSMLERFKANTKDCTDAQAMVYSSPKDIQTSLVSSTDSSPALRESPTSPSPGENIYSIRRPVLQASVPINYQFTGQYSNPSSEQPFVIHRDQTLQNIHPSLQQAVNYNSIPGSPVSTIPTESHTAPFSSSTTLTETDMAENVVMQSPKVITIENAPFTADGQGKSLANMVGHTEYTAIIMEHAEMQQVASPTDAEKQTVPAETAEQQVESTFSEAVSQTASTEIFKG